MEKKWDKKEISTRWVDHHKDEWEKRGNPLSVWRAYSECRGAGLEIPEWVYKYLDRVGSNFWRLSSADTPKPGKGEVLPAIAAALEMKGKGKSGRVNVFTDLFAHTDKIGLAMRVDWYIRGGHKKGMALEHVAKEEGVSKSTVSRAWDECGPIHFKKSFNKKTKK